MVLGMYAARLSQKADEKIYIYTHITRTHTHIYICMHTYSTCVLVAPWLRIERVWIPLAPFTAL